MLLNVVSADGDAASGADADGVDVSIGAGPHAHEHNAYSNSDDDADRTFADGHNGNEPDAQCQMMTVMQEDAGGGCG